VPFSLADTVLVTHQGCMDGSMCAITFLRAGGKPENIRFVAAGMVERFLKGKGPDEGIMDDPRFALFADVGVTDPKYADLLEKRGSCVMLDHHRTTIYLKDRPWCFIDELNTACGSVLLAQYLWVNKLILNETYEELLPLLKLVDANDRWLPNRPGAAEDLATLSAFLGQDRFIKMFKGFAAPNLLLENLFDEFQLELLEILKERRDEHIETSIKRMVIKNLNCPDGRTFKTGFSFSQSQDTSLLMHRMLDARPDIQLAAHVNLHKKQMSLRSRGDVDCSVIASQFKGGGHIGAAGFPLPDGTLTEIVEILCG
jgi:oligoribonuclease NrnB/cAMP/cGMP phosphodiesterase (DHH superfamily)